MAAPFLGLTSLRASPFYACGVFKFLGFQLRHKALRLYYLMMLIINICFHVYISMSGTKVNNKLFA